MHDRFPTFLRIATPTYHNTIGGKLALSGVLEEQADAVLAAYADSFELQVTERSGGWVLLSGVRYDTYSNRSEQEQDKNKKG